MKNGTVIWKACEQCYEAEVEDFHTFAGKDTAIIWVKKAELTDEPHPEPFNDGKYLHYTRFHPQLRDMIGTEGCFYDEHPESGYYGVLSGRNCQGYPNTVSCAHYSYFAVPIEQPKTEITLQEIADRFGVAVEQLRIKE